MKQHRKWLAVLLSLALIMTLLPVATMASTPNPTYEDYVFVTQDITTNTTWESGKKYIICGDRSSDNSDTEIEVKPGAVLTIEAGATVLFGQHKQWVSDGNSLKDRLYVRGTLNIEGTANDHVTVKSYYPKNSEESEERGLSRYAGFIFQREAGSDATPTGSIRWCDFEGGGYSSGDCRGALTIQQNRNATPARISVFVDHCTFTDASYKEATTSSDLGSGIVINAENETVGLTVRNSVFGREDALIGAGILDLASEGERKVTVSGCSFLGCGPGHQNGRLHVMNFNNSAAASRYVVENCEFVTHPKRPIPIFRDGTLTKEQCIITDCTFDITSDDADGNSFNLGDAMSGLPIQSLTINHDRINIQSQQHLVIADDGLLTVGSGGTLRVQPCATIVLGERARLNAADGTLDFSTDRAGSDWFTTLLLKEGATVSGLTLYNGDGVTEVTRTGASPEEEYRYAWSLHWRALGPDWQDRWNEGAFEIARRDKWERVTSFTVELPQLSSKNEYGRVSNDQYNSTFEEQVGKVEYSLDGGATWKSLHDSKFGDIGTSVWSTVQYPAGYSVTIVGGAPDATCKFRATPLADGTVFIDGKRSDFQAAVTLAPGGRTSIEFNGGSYLGSAPIGLTYESTTLNVNDTLNIAYTYDGDGSVTVESSDPDGTVATVTHDTAAKTIAVHGVNTGTVTLTVSAPQTELYKGSSVTLKLTVRGPVFEIRTAEDLITYARERMYYDGADAILMADIKLNDDVLSKVESHTTAGLTKWTPMGNEYGPFQCEFDGNGHTISGLYYDSTATAGGAYFGLFGWIGAFASVHDLHLRDSYINVDYSHISGSSVNVGGICGRTAVYLRNCSFDGEINVKAGYASVGGLAGFGKAWKCCNLGDIVVETTRSISYVGGVVGEGYTTQKCCNVGSVTAALADDHTENAEMMVGAVSQTDYQEDCYYLAGSCTEDPETDAIVKTEAEFASGSVCRLVQFHCVDDDRCVLCGAEKGVTGSHTVTEGVMAYTVTGVALGSAKPVTVIAAQYQSGRMTGIQKAAVTLTSARPSAEGAFRFTEAQGTAYQYKLFLLDPVSCAPLCP